MPYSLNETGGHTRLPRSYRREDVLVRYAKDNSYLPHVFNLGALRHDDAMKTIPGYLVVELTGSE